MRKFLGNEGVVNLIINASPGSQPKHIPIIFQLNLRYRYNENSCVATFSLGIVTGHTGLMGCRASVNPVRVQKSTTITPISQQPIPVWLTVCFSDRRTLGGNKRNMCTKD